MSDDAPRHRGRTPRSRLVVKRTLITVGIILAILATVLVVAYKHLEGNITAIDISGKLGNRPPAVKVEGATQPINVLVMGSDTREGANGKGIGGSTPGLSDTTILLHLSANRKFAYGVSLPRDAMVERPACERKDGTGQDPGGITQFNAAYAVGGPACTVKTVEHLTGIRIQHFVVVDFVGFRSMVDAINGVTVCVPTEVNDTVGHIKLPAGTYEVTGQQALDYVRVRHDLGAPTGDIGRMKRQQTFIAAMIKKVVSAGTLTNPIRLYNFLNAATSSLTTDPDFAHLKELASLGKSLKNIGLDRVQFVTVPWQPWPEDSNRVEWSPDAGELWTSVRLDRPLADKFKTDAVTPGKKPGKILGPPSHPPSPASPGANPANPAGPARQDAANAQMNGLCN